jgi:hypothetical protein
MDLCCVRHAAVCVYTTGERNLVITVTDIAACLTEPFVGPMVSLMNLENCLVTGCGDKYKYNGGLQLQREHAEVEERIQSEQMKWEEICKRACKRRKAEI